MVQNTFFGISEREALILLDHCDSKSQGEVSFEDFLRFLQDITLKGRPVDLQLNSNSDDDSSIFDSNNPRELEWRLKVFLENFAAYLVKYALKLRITRLVGIRCLKSKK
jgi:hypothetical protein